jgi:hypothetical protein
VRSGVTWIVVAAIGLLAALAVADALRNDGSSSTAAASTPATTTSPKPATLRGTLRSEVIAGLVMYSDQDCRLHSLLLPRMVDDVVRDDSGGDVFHCRFSVAGGRVLDGDVVGRPGRLEVARCRGDHIAVWNAESGAAVRSIRGCHPAWRPDGGLTYARGNAVYEGGRKILTGADLHRAARKHPGLAGASSDLRLHVRVTDLAWLDATHLVVALEIIAPAAGPPRFLAVVFRNRTVTTVAADFRGPYEHLFVSDDGLLAGSADGTVFTRSGQTIDPPTNLPPGRAVCFTPDDRWLVWLSGSSIFLVGSHGGDQPARIIRLPIAARDLVWEPISSGTAYGPPIRR